MPIRFEALKEEFGTRVEAPLMDRLTALGEQRGADWLIYNPLRMRMFHRYAVRDAPAVMAAIEKVLPAASSYVDVGAGSGAFAAEARRRGHEVVALERSRVGRWLGKRQGVNCHPFDLNEGLDQLASHRSDLAYSFEVAEHLPPELGDRLVGVLALLAPLVVFTAAHPGQGGSGHINEQPRKYWQDRFAAHGLDEAEQLSSQLRAAFVEARVEGPWFAQNVSVFQSNGRRTNDS